MSEHLHQNPTSLNRPLIALRVAVALLLGVHGFYRAFSGSVSGFASFLTSTGLPIAIALAWAITIFEMIGSLCLLAGRFVRIVIPGFVLILAMGIILVHAREGWFVVGGGRNGVEFSLLLIITLLVLYASNRATDRPAA